jgi:hypothetical protein
MICHHCCIHANFDNRFLLGYKSKEVEGFKCLSGMSDESPGRVLYGKLHSAHPRSKALNWQCPGMGMLVGPTEFVHLNFYKPELNKCCGNDLYFRNLHRE